MRLHSRSLSSSVLSKCEPDLSKFLVKGGLLRGSVGKNIVLTGIGFTVVPDTHMRVSAAGILRKLGQQTLHPPGYGR